MNISFEKVDKVNALITVKLEKADYEESVNAALKNFRKKANMPGFRPGQVPMSMIKRRFGAEIKAEEINKILGHEIYDYLLVNKIRTLGEPLPNMEKTPALDFETMDDFTFVFDLGLAPEFDATLSENDTVDYYEIKVDDEMVEDQIKAYAQRAGKYTRQDSYKDNDMVKGLLAQLDGEGNTLEGGIQVEGAVMLPIYMKNADERAKFDNAKLNDVIVFNPSNAYDGSTIELSSLLRITKEEAAGMKSDFSFQVEEITRYMPAEVNQDLFDMILGEGVAKSKEEFADHIRQMMETQFKADSEFKFILDLRAYMEARVGELELPETLLKRVIKTEHPDKDDEYIENTFKSNRRELVWHLIREQLKDKISVMAEEPDVLEAAKAQARSQFEQYGMMNVPDDTLAKYANEMLKDKAKAEEFKARAENKMIAEKAKGIVKLNKKSVSLAEFNKLFENTEKE